MIIELSGLGKRDGRWSDSYPWMPHFGSSTGESRPGASQPLPDSDVRAAIASGNQGPDLLT